MNENPLHPRDVPDYLLLTSHMPHLLSELVNAAIRMGMKPYGRPFTIKGEVVGQAVIATGRGLG